MTSIPHTAEREAMEEWLRRNPDVRFWNSADQMFAAWQARAALAVGEGGQPVAVMEAPKDWIGGLTTYAPHQANKGGMQRGGDYVRLADVIVAYAGSLAPPASPAEQAATQAEAKVAWIDAKDRLPTHNYSVLGVIVDGPLVVAGDPDDRLRDVISYEPSRGWLQHVDGSDVVVTVTHWQDLPDLP